MEWRVSVRLCYCLSKNRIRQVKYIGRDHRARIVIFPRQPFGLWSKQGWKLPRHLWLSAARKKSMNSKTLPEIRLSTMENCWTAFMHLPTPKMPRSQARTTCQSSKFENLKPTWNLLWLPKDQTSSIFDTTLTSWQMLLPRKESQSTLQQRILMSWGWTDCRQHLRQHRHQLQLG